MPGVVSGLLGASLGESIRNVERLVQNWMDGSTRFNRRGEALLVAASAGDVVGVGGLLRCRDVQGALRVSRFYVDPEHRRLSVASALAAELLRRCVGCVELVTCNAQASPSARQFWESVGFKPVEHAGITHTWRALDVPNVVSTEGRDTNVYRFSLEA